MKALRVLVAVLLCLALPLQGAATVRIAATPCPAKHGDAAAIHGDLAPAKHDGCQPMPCQEPPTSQSLAGCDSCAHCVPSPAFLSLDALPDGPRHPQDLRPQRRTPALHPLALFAIWRPPTTC